MYKLKLGFTLIELLVVISIIGILAGLSLVSFTGAQKQARDTQRQSDLKQYQNLIESMASQRRGLYPSRPTPVGPVLANTLCGSTNCPDDPSAPTYHYNYISNGTIAAGCPPSCPYNATAFVLWAYQENSAKYFIICSGGDTGLFATEPSSSVCPSPLE